MQRGTREIKKWKNNN